MRNGSRWAGGILLFVVLAILGMAAFDICPPEGPWPQPPWCPAAPTPTPRAESQEAVTADSTETPEVDLVEPVPEALAALVADLFTGLARVQTYYDQALESLVAFTPSLDAELILGSAPETAGGGHASVRSTQAPGPANIPEDFINPLPDDGFLVAPAGTGGEGVSAQVRFVDQGGETITGERLADEEVQILGIYTLSGGDPESESLESIVTDVLQPGDMRLTTAAGWDEALWQRLAEEQQPLDSLLEYHLWTSAEEMEGLLAASIVKRMQAMGIPSVVIEAFRQSDTTGWLASHTARAREQLASMEILVDFEGKITATLEVERSFALTGGGQAPEWGALTGVGEITFEHPALEQTTFELSLEWNEWDEVGRVIGGELQLADESSGYEIELTLIPGGTKSGNLYLDEQLIGRLSMMIVGTEATVEFLPLD